MTPGSRYICARCGGSVIVTVTAPSGLKPGTRRWHHTNRKAECPGPVEPILRTERKLSP